MVSYTEWTSIGHDVYKQKGGTYPSNRTAAEITQTLAEFWSQNKDRLKSANRSEARRIAQQNMTV